ncbi:MAG: hypothetical protein JRL30_28465 [Deltaproteobacteria bacterium]|nr:hypothetical protein [Deltaproteobacteria bacterium]
MIITQFIGFKALERKFSSMSVKADLAMNKTVKELAKKGEGMARNLINQGPPRSGRPNFRRGYNRSAPYEPAKTDLGHLAYSISSSSLGKSGEFGTGLSYGVKLELGNGVAPRPFLLPTAFKLRRIAGATLARNASKIRFGKI